MMLEVNIVKEIENFVSKVMVGKLKIERRLINMRVFNVIMLIVVVFFSVYGGYDDDVISEYFF